MVGKAVDQTPGEQAPPYLDALLLMRAARPPPSLGSPPPPCPDICASESGALTSVTEGIGDLTSHLTHNPSKKGWMWSHPPCSSGF